MTDTKSPWGMPLCDLYEVMGDGSGKGWADKKVAQVKVDRLKWSFLNFICLLFIVSLFYCNPLNEDWHTWFSRFGSLILISSVLVEYYFLNKFKDVINFSEHSTPVYCVIYVQRKFKSTVSYSKRYTLFMTVIGTVIWGYGDLIYIHLKN